MAVRLEQQGAEPLAALAGAETKPFQFAIASSTGASARAARMELAIITPGVTSPAITR